MSKWSSEKWWFKLRRNKRSLNSLYSTTTLSKPATITSNGPKLGVSTTSSWALTPTSLSSMRETRRVSLLNTCSLKFNQFTIVISLNINSLSNLLQINYNSNWETRRNSCFRTYCKPISLSDCVTKLTNTLTSNNSSLIYNLRRQSLTS